MSAERATERTCSRNPPRYAWCTVSAAGQIRSFSACSAVMRVSSSRMDGSWTWAISSPAPSTSPRPAGRGEDAVFLAETLRPVLIGVDRRIRSTSSCTRPLNSSVRPCTFTNSPPSNSSRRRAASLKNAPLIRPVLSCSVSAMNSSPASALPHVLLRAEEKAPAVQIGEFWMKGRRRRIGHVRASPFCTKTTRVLPRISPPGRLRPSGPGVAFPRTRGPCSSVLADAE